MKKYLVFAVIGYCFFLFHLCEERLLGKDMKEYPAFRIIYSSSISGDSEIYLSDLKGKRSKRITNSPLHDGYADFSPDGRQIVFYSYYDEGKTWSLNLMNRDGAGRRRLTSKKNVRDTAPKWSPDGKKIIFARKEKGVYRVYTIDPDGKELRRLKIPFGLSPSILKNGKVLFSSHWEKHGEICLSDADGSNIQSLTRNDAADGHPSVSPDGRRILFYSKRDGNSEIYVMNLDGSKQIRLTHHAADDSGPKFSPDGSKILFVSNRDGDYDIYVMNADGSSVEAVTTNNVRDIQAAWLK